MGRQHNLDQAEEKQEETQCRRNGGKEQKKKARKEDTTHNNIHKNEAKATMEVRGKNVRGEM